AQAPPTEAIHVQRALGHGASNLRISAHASNAPATPTARPPSTSARKCRPRYIRDSPISSGQATASAQIHRLRAPKNSASASANAAAALVCPLTQPKLGSCLARLAAIASSEGRPQNVSAAPSASRWRPLSPSWSTRASTSLGLGRPYP